MNAMEIGKRLVAHANAHRSDLAVDELYDEHIVSIEPATPDGTTPNSVQGIDAIRAKHAAWFDANTVHGEAAEGPYVGHEADKFAVRFNVDLTPKGGERVQLEEMGVYTVLDGKIVKEEYFYLMDGA